MIDYDNVFCWIKLYELYLLMRKFRKCLEPFDLRYNY